jgi:hypothetical protein
MADAKIEIATIPSVERGSACGVGASVKSDHGHGRRTVAAACHSQSGWVSRPAEVADLGRAIGSRWFP